MGRHPSAHDFAAAALLLLTSVSTLVLVLCALCSARRRGDTARSWIVLYRTALAFFVLAIVLSLAKHLLAIVYREFYDVSFQANATAVLSGLLQAQVETNVIGALFHGLALVFCLVALVGLASGISIAHFGQKQSSVDRVIRLASYAVAALLVILHVVAFALSEKLFVVFYAHQDMRQQSLDAPETIWQALRANKVTLPILVIQLLFALAVFAHFVRVAVRTRLDPRVKTATRYLGLCALLLLLKTSYDVGFYAQFLPPETYQPVDQTSLPEPYFVIVNILLSLWPVFFVLVALLVLAVKKQRGLWATDHPLTANTGPDMPLQTPWGYSYSPQSQQPLHPASQQPSYPGPGSSPPPPAPYGQHASEGHYAQFRQGASPPPQWQGVTSPHHQQPPYAMTGSLPSPPPPAHSEAMGLYHQADGMPPQVVPLPYDEKR